MRVLLAQRVLRIQFVDKKFSLPQIECLKRFREPIIDRDKKLATAALGWSQRAAPRILLAALARSLERGGMRFPFADIRLRCQQRNFS